MSEISPEIDALVAEQDRDRLVGKLQKLVDQFLASVELFSDEQIATFDAVIGRLAAQADPHARLELSRRLAAEPLAPPRVVEQLANDDHIGVAEPVLIESERLTPDALVDIAVSQGQAHLLAISKRRGIGPAVSDVLIARGNRTVLHALSRNGKAEFSPSGPTMLALRMKALNHEKRQAARKAVNYPATVVFPEDGERLSCTLVDISKTGARLYLATMRRAPETILLCLAGQAGATRKCGLVWQNGQEIGVRFLT